MRCLGLGVFLSVGCSYTLRTSASRVRLHTAWKCRCQHETTSGCCVTGKVVWQSDVGVLKILLAGKYLEICHGGEAM